MAGGLISTRMQNWEIGWLRRGRGKYKELGRELTSGRMETWVENLGFKWCEDGILSEEGRGTMMEN